MTLSFEQPCAHRVSLVPSGSKRNEVRSWTQTGNLSAGRRVAHPAADLPDSSPKIGIRPAFGKGYSATSCRDSASFLMREMKVSSGMAPRSLPERNRTATLPSCRLPLAHHQHVGDFLELGVADLLLHPLIGGVDVHPQARSAIDHRRVEQAHPALSGRSRRPSRRSGSPAPGSAPARRGRPRHNARSERR